MDEVAKASSRKISIAGRNVVTLVRDALNEHSDRVWTRTQMTSYLVEQYQLDAQALRGGSVSAAFTDLTRHYGVLVEVEKGKYKRTKQTEDDNPYLTGPLTFRGTPKKPKAVEEEPANAKGGGGGGGGEI